MPLGFWLTGMDKCRRRGKPREEEEEEEHLSSMRRKTTRNEERNPECIHNDGSSKNLHSDGERLIPLNTFADSRRNGAQPEEN